MTKKIVTALTIALSVSALASANIQKLMQDTQRVKQNGKTMTLVWWIPSEFWSTTLKENPDLTSKQVDDLVKVLDQYSVFVVCRESTGPLGGMTFANSEEIKTNTTLKVGDEILPPLSTKDLSPGAQNFFVMMKPMMANMLGQFGQGMEFLVYPNTKEGKRIIDPTQKGNFEYTAFGEKEKWRLPLGSLLPPMYDEKTGEQFPGNYIYNPFTGEKLTKKILSSQ